MMYAFGLLASILAFFLGYLAALLRGQDFIDQIRGLREAASEDESDRQALEEELVIARRERDDSWDYANRLLESPQYYADQVGTIRAVAAAPLYGAFGRLPETEA